jgi:flagellar motor component MotA
MFNKKQKERKFKAFLIIFGATFLALIVGRIDQEVFKHLAIFCGSFYAGANVLTKIVGVFESMKAKVDTSGVA